MGALKLHTEQNYTSLKVVYRSSFASENIAQRFLSVDPVPSAGVSDYATFYNNPIENTDVEGDKPGDKNGKCITCPEPKSSTIPTLDKRVTSRQDNLAAKILPKASPSLTANTKKVAFFEADNRTSTQKENDRRYTEERDGSTVRGFLVKNINAYYNPIRWGMNLYSFGISNPGHDSRGRAMSLGEAEHQLLGLGLSMAPAIYEIANPLVKVYRATDRASEILAYQQTGFVFSDAARAGYYETGSIKLGIGISQEAHRSWVSLWWNDMSSYVQAHGQWGTEMAEAFNMRRTMISVTTDPKVLPNFGKTIFSGYVRRSNLVKQILSGSTESEYLIKFGTDKLKITN